MPRHLMRLRDSFNVITSGKYKLSIILAGSVRSNKSRGRNAHRAVGRVAGWLRTCVWVRCEPCDGRRGLSASGRRGGAVPSVFAK